MSCSCRLKEQACKLKQVPDNFENNFAPRPDTVVWVATVAGAEWIVIHAREHLTSLTQLRIYNLSDELERTAAVYSCLLSSFC